MRAALAEREARFRAMIEHASGTRVFRLRMDALGCPPQLSRRGPELFAALRSLGLISLFIVIDDCTHATAGLHAAPPEKTPLRLRRC